MSHVGDEATGFIDTELISLSCQGPMMSLIDVFHHGSLQGQLVDKQCSNLIH